jgi:hypothetical protein
VRATRSGKLSPDAGFARFAASRVMAAGECGFQSAGCRTSRTAPAPSRRSGNHARAQRRARRDRCRSGSARCAPQAHSDSAGRFEARAEQAVAASGDLAKRVERNLRAMCLRWAADHGRRFCTAAPQRRQMARQRRLSGQNIPPPIRRRATHRCGLARRKTSS